MLFGCLQTKAVVQDICDWQDGMLSQVYYDLKGMLYTDIMTVLL